MAFCGCARFVENRGMKERLKQIYRAIFGREDFQYTSYSQAGEDRIINLIRKQLKLEEFRYVDIGACNGVHHSNTCLFYRMGFRGVLVEANPLLLDRISRARSADKLIHAGVVPSQMAGSSPPELSRNELKRHGHLFGKTGGRTQAGRLHRRTNNPCASHDPRRIIGPTLARTRSSIVAGCRGARRIHPRGLRSEIAPPGHHLRGNLDRHWQKKQCHQPAAKSRRLPSSGRHGCELYFRAGRKLAIQQPGELNKRRFIA